MLGARSADLIAVQVVNGYVCRDCTDVDLAKKGIDPARPRLPDGRPATSEAKRDAREAALGVNKPLAHGDVGTRVNVFA